MAKLLSTSRFPLFQFRPTSSALFVEWSAPFYELGLIMRSSINSSGSSRQLVKVFSLSVSQGKWVPFDSFLAQIFCIRIIFHVCVVEAKHRTSQPSCHNAFFLQNETHFVSPGELSFETQTAESFRIARDHYKNERKTFESHFSKIDGGERNIPKTRIKATLGCRKLIPQYQPVAGLFATG